jgi:F420 biosynthesis protein FbiB-like protein
MTATSVPAFLDARRSIRAFRPEPVAREALDALVAAACIAPAPHHSRPWRFVVVDGDDAKVALASGMGARWRIDLEGDGVASDRVDELVAASHAKLVQAPALVLGCLTWDGLDRYPDERRRRAEWGMALLSLGAAVENLMLAAADRGLASCWVAAPIAAPKKRGTLSLPAAWLPRARMVGHPDPAYVEASVRPSPPTTSHLPPVTFSGRRGVRRQVLRVRATPSSGRRGFHQVDAGPKRIEGAARSHRARRLVARAADAGETGHDVEQLLDRRLDAGADVHQQAAALVGRAHERVDNVVDVHEVTRLAAVPVDDWSVVVQQLAREDRDHAGLALRDLTRSVDIGERERGVLEPAHGSVVVQVVDDRFLRDAVRRLRCCA